MGDRPLVRSLRLACNCQGVESATKAESAVEYNTRFECLAGEVRAGGQAPAEKSRISVSLKPIAPVFDESLFPEGVYRLKTERDTLRLQKLGGSWELLAVK